MVPMAKYELAAQLGSLLFSRGTAAMRHDVAARLQVDYVYLGPHERTTYPDSVEVFRQGTDFFESVFDNGDVTIYRVRY